MNRRNFIKLGCGVLAFGMGVGAYSYVGTKGSGAKRSAYYLQIIEGLPEGLCQVLYLASLAPSGHNAQPWQVNIKEPCLWRIGSNQKRWLQAVDAENRKLLLSIGAFMENLSLAAGCYGYRAEFKQIGQDSFSEELVEVKLSPAEEIVDAAIVKIKERRTLRKNLQKKAVAVNELAFLTDGIKNVKYFPLSSLAGQNLSLLVLEANRLQSERVAVQAELAEWIRWTAQDAKQHGNGLTPDSMEMSGFIKWYAEHFMDKQDVGTAEFKRQTLDMVTEQVENCAGWLVVGSEGSEMDHIISAGRQMEAMWLRAKEKNIAFHPMTQPLEEVESRKKLAEIVGNEKPVQFIIRIGYVEKYPQPVSLRMEMQKIIVW